MSKKWDELIEKLLYKRGIFCKLDEEEWVVDEEEDWRPYDLEVISIIPKELDDMLDEIRQRGYEPATPLDLIRSVIKGELTVPIEIFTPYRVVIVSVGKHKPCECCRGFLTAFFAREMGSSEYSRSQKLGILRMDHLFAHYNKPFHDPSYVIVRKYRQ